MNEIFGMPPAEWLAQQVRDNQMLVAIVGGMMLGSMLYLLRSIPQRLWRLFLLQCTVVMTVHNDTASYDEIFAFLICRGFVSYKTRRLTLDKRVSMEVNNMTRSVNAGFGASEPDQDHLTLGSGWHVFWYRGRPFLLDHEIGEAKMRERPRTLTIRTFGRSRRVMSEFVREASHMRATSMNDRLSVWTYNGRCWECITQKTRRPLDTVVIDAQQKAGITADLEWFMNNPDWYQERGIPYRRGYLFYGPPGTGKTSLIFALASHYAVPVYMLNLSTLLGDDTLMDALGSLPDGVFLLIEDIDATGVHVEPRKGGRRPPAMDGPAEEESEAEAADPRPRGGVTLSGLMNALDGIASPDRLVTFMTTNHPEHIEPALLRPGRVDRREELGYPGLYEANAMFQRFFPEAGNSAAARFAEAVDASAESYTAADLQELCMEHADNPEGAIDHLRSSLRDHHLEEVSGR